VLLGATALAAFAGRDNGIAREVLTGPFEAQVLRVIDGDTLRVRTRIWLGTDVEINVRIDGVDAPELRGRCAAERRLAGAARDALTALIDGNPVLLHDVRYGKYAGRVVARVTVAGGADAAVALVARGLARRYAGRARGRWCGA